MIMPSAFADRSKLTPELHAQYLAPFADADSRGAVLWPLARALMGSDAYYRSLWDRRGTLKAFPALVIWGTEDPAFPVHHLNLWREVLPHARIVELPVGHWPQEEAPESVIAAMEDFLALGHE
jgi:haloalkane dehalogenase